MTICIIVREIKKRNTHGANDAQKPYTGPRKCWTTTFARFGMEYALSRSLENSSALSGAFS